MSKFMFCTAMTISLRRQHIIWILICLLEYTNACDDITSNQRVPENEHDRQLDNVDLTPNDEVHPKGYKTIKHPDGQEVSNKHFTDDKQAHFNEYDDVATVHLVEENDNEQNLVKLTKCKNNFSQDVIADNNRNSEDVKDKLLGANVTTIYLAGYDDQIFNLMYDIKKQGLGYDLLVYFYIFTNNMYRNIGYLYTNKKILHDSILKYTHYFCLNYSNSANSCLESLGIFNSEVTIGPEVNEQQLINVDSKGSIVSDKVNTEPEHNSFNEIQSTNSDLGEHYPIKQISGAYEFLLPKLNSTNFKDIYIDLLKSNDLNNAESIVEVLNTNNEAKSDPKLHQQRLYYLEAKPSEAINIDATAKKQVDAHILIDPLNVDRDFINNDSNNVKFEIPDQSTQVNQGYNEVSEVKSNKTDSVLQLIPCKGQEHGHLIYDTNMQVINGSNNYNSQTEIMPNGNQGNMITVPNDNLQEIFDKVTENRNTLENAIILNEANQAIDDKNVNGGNMVLNLVPSDEITDINPNLENTNALNNASNKNIMLNNVLNEEFINTTPQINEMEIVKNTEGVETNVIGDQVSNDKNNIKITEETPHAHTFNDITRCEPSASFAQSPESRKNIIIPNENILQVSQDPNPFVALEKAPMKDKESELVSYLKYINPNIMTNTLPLITQMIDLNTIPKGTLKSQLPCTNVDNSVIANCYNFPKIGMDIKKVPQSQMLHYHNGFDVFSKPCKSINNHIFDNKQHYHALPSSYSQYSEIPNRNKQKLEDQKQNFNVPSNWPFNILRIIPGGTDPFKYQQTPNVITSFSNNRNIIKYVEPDASRKPENILDLPKLNQNNNFQNVPEEISQINDENFLNAIHNQNKTDQSQIVINMPGKDSIVKYYNKAIYRDKNNAIFYPTLSVRYPNTSDKLYQPMVETKYSNTYYMPDSCAYKNLLTLEGNVHPTANTPPASVIYTGDTSLVNNKVPGDHKHIDGELVPMNNNHHIQAKVPVTSRLTRIPLSQNYNTYLSNLQEVKDKMFPFTRTLTPYASEKDISNEYLYKDLFTIRPEFVYDPRAKGHLTLPTKFKNVTDKSGIENQNEPIVKYVNYKPPRQPTVLPTNLNSLPSLYYSTLLNINPSTKNRYDSFLSNFRSPLHQKGYAQGQLSDFTVSEGYPKTNDLHVSEPLNNVNYNPGNRNPILLQTLTPTILKPFNAKASLPISYVPTITDSAYNTPYSRPVSQKSTYPFYPSSIPPIQNKKITSDADMTTNLLPLQSTKESLSYPPLLDLVKQNLYHTTQSNLKSHPPCLNKESFNTEQESSNLDSQAVYFSNFKSTNAKNIKNENSLGTSLVIPITKVMQDKHTPTSLFTDTASLKPIATLDTLLQSKRSKTIPLMQEGKYTYYENTPRFSGSVTPPLAQGTLPFNYITLPNSINSFSPNHLSIKDPLKPFPQNIVKYINAVSPISIISNSNTSPTPDIHLSGDTINFPYFSHISHVDAKLNSITPKTESSQLNMNPSICTDKYLTFLNSLHNPLQTKPIQAQNILAEYEKILPPVKASDVYSPDDYTIFPKPYPSAPQSVITYLSPIEKLENIPVKLLGATKGTYTLPMKDLTPPVISPSHVMSPYLDKSVITYLAPNEMLENIPIKLSGANLGSYTLPMKDLKPLAFATNNEMSSYFAYLKKDQWLHSHLKSIHSETQGNNKNIIEIVTPPIIKVPESLIQGNANFVPLTQNEILSTRPYYKPKFPSSVPMQNLISTNSNPDLVSSNILPWIYNPSTTSPQNPVTWITPCKSQRQKPILGMKNKNVVNPYEISQATDKELSHKTLPLNYAEGYGLPSQVTYTEPTPLYPIANQAQFPFTMVSHTSPMNSDLHAQTMSTSTMNNFPTQMKSTESNIAWPLLSSKNLLLFKPKYVNPSSYSQSKVTHIPASSNNMINPIINVLNPNLSVSTGFDDLSSPMNFLKYTSNAQPISQETKITANKVNEIPLFQVTPSDLSVSQSLHLSPNNFDSISNPHDLKFNPGDKLSAANSPLGFHSHVSTLSNSPQNNNVWSSLLPYSKILTNTPNAVIGPELGKMSLDSRPAYTNTIIPSPGSACWLPFSKPMLQAQYLSPYYYSVLQSQMHRAKTDIKNINLNSMYQIDPSLSTGDINKTDINFSVLPDTYQGISPIPLTQSTSFLHPKANYAIKWANLGDNAKLTTSPNTNVINSDSVPSQLTVYPTVSSLLSSATVRLPSTLTYISGGHKDTPVSSVGYTPLSLLAWKSLRPFVKNPGKEEPTSIYASVVTQSNNPTFETNGATYLNNKPNSQSSAYFPNYYGIFPTAKEVKSKSYQKPSSNNLIYEYDNKHQNNQIITPKIVNNLPHVAYTNEPYLANYESIPEPSNAINKINNILRNHIKQSDLLANNLNKKVITIPLNNIGIAKSEPTDMNKVYYVKTDNPDIILQAWPTTVKILKAKIVLEYDDLNALNFRPVVKVKNGQYSNEVVKNIVVDFVNKTYGKPIIAPAFQDYRTMYSFFDDIDRSFIKNNKIYIVWSNV